MKRETIQISNGVNLLPPQQKKELLEEERFKLVLILGILGLLFLVSLSLILFSVKIYISGKAEAQKILVGLEEKKFEIPEVRDLEKEIKLINQNLSKLNSFYKGQPNFTELLEKISEAVPGTIYLTNLSFNPVPQREDRLRISLGGYSPSRELLSEFKKRLQAQPAFEEIYFPPSSWITPEDFSATLEIKI